MSQINKMYLLFLSLILMSFRLILASYLKGGGKVILLFCFFSILYVVISGMNKATLKSLPFKVFGLLYLLYFVFFIYVIGISRDSAAIFNFISQRSFSTVLASVVVLLGVSQFSTSRIFWAIDHAVKLLLPSSSIIFIVNNYFTKMSYELYRAEDIIKNVFRFSGELTNQRTIGMMINLENSALATAMLYSYFTYRFIVSRIIQQKRVGKSTVAIFLIGSLGVLTTTSVSVILATMVQISIFSIYLAVKIGQRSKRQKYIFITILAGLVGVFYVLSGYIFNLTNRLTSYLNAPQNLLSNIYAEKGDSWLNFFFNTNVVNLKGSGFGINEVHVLLGFSYLGLLPTLIWYLIFCSVIYFFFYLKSFNHRELAIYSMMSLTFVVSLHYAGATAWPNNIFYFLGFAILYRRVALIKKYNSKYR